MSWSSYHLGNGLSHLRQHQTGHHRTRLLWVRQKTAYMIKTAISVLCKKLTCNYFKYLRHFGKYFFSMLSWHRKLANHLWRQRTTAVIWVKYQPCGHVQYQVILPPNKSSLTQAIFNHFLLKFLNITMSTLLHWLQNAELLLLQK